MRRVVAVVALALVLAGCADDGPVPTPGPVTTAVPDPDLTKIKTDAGIRDCMPGTATDSKLPDLPLLCLGGGPDVNLSSLKGPMIINLWASWCDECPEELPWLQAFDQAHGDEVPVLGIDWQDKYPDKALEMAATAKVTYPLLADPIGETSARSPLPRIRGLPDTVFIDESGDVVGVKIGPLKSEAELAELAQKYLGVEP